LFFEAKASYLHIKAIDTYLMIFFVMRLHPYFQLSTTRMKQNDSIKHKEIVVICQKNELKGYKSLFSQLVNKNGGKTIVVANLACVNW
jgi:hypothetical protein